MIQEELDFKLHKLMDWLNDRGGMRFEVCEIKLEGLTISNCNLTLSELSSVVIKKCKIKNVTIEGANWYGVKLIDWDIENTSFEDFLLNESNLISTIMKDNKIIKNNLLYSIINLSCMNEVVFAETNLKNVSINNARLNNCIFKEVDLVGTSFDKTVDCKVKKISVSNEEEAFT